MPTGLTNGIYDGTDMDFRSFALKCATHFGGGYEASDYGDGKLPMDKAPELKPNDFYYNELRETIKELTEWEHLKANPEKAKVAYEEEVARRNLENEVYKKSKSELRERYEEMLAKVKSWEPEKEYVCVKDFMINQLEDSINFDCPKNYMPYDTVMPPLEEWIDFKLRYLRESVESYKENVVKEIKRVEEKNLWLKGFYISLDKFKK